ncbi:MAG: ribonuclease HI [Clostridia bacterium]|nr:ribonuclease HI [Clostridia bacterium]
MDHVTIYTDGACSGNPGPGGWGAILRYGEKELELSGSHPATTNNRMELTGAVEALSRLKRPCRVSLYSDSKYLVDAMKLGWAARWEKNGWKRNAKEKALNPDLWEKLLSLCRTHEVEFIWVKGHADNPYNNRCDALAVGEYKKLQK